MAAKDAITAPLGSMSPYIGSRYGYGVPGQETEHIPDLLWPTSVATLARMRTDPVIASILAAYTGPLLAADWRIDPRGADPEAVRVCCDSLGIPAVGEDAEDIGAVRRRGVKFVEHVRLAALHLVWGHFAFYPYYEVRADGLAYLAGLPERMPSTIVEIRVNDDGTLRSVVQEGMPGKATNAVGGVELLAKDLLWYTHKREGANWAGNALIRPCYSDWLLKIEGKRSNAVGLSRFSAGTPVAEPLPGTNPTPAQIAEAQRMVSAVRVGQTGGAVPVGFKLRIIGIEGTLPDSLASLNYYDSQMRAAALVSVLDLGSSAHGSRALGETFSDLLKGAIQSVADGMAETATQLCERLTSLNFGEDAIPPAVTCGDVGASKAAIAASITGLVAAGLVTPDESLEAFTREGYHLPPKDPAPVVEQVQASGWQPWVRAAGGADRNRGNGENLRQYYTRGEGAAMIRWGSPGDHSRCVDLVSKHMTVDQAHGYCQLREKEVTGLYTSQHAKKLRASSAPEQTGIMVALRVPPTEAKALALTSDGAEPAEELHLTLVFLGDTKDVADEAAYVGTVLNVVRDVAARHPVIAGQISGSGRFTTPENDAVYLSYDSPDLPDLRQDLFESLKAAGIEPVANHGFSPHITLAYVPKGTPDPLDHVDVSDLTFPGITFAYGGQQITAPLVAPEWPPPGAFKLTDELAISGPSIVNAAEGDPKAYREPTSAEQAAGLDPQQIDEEHDGLVAEGLALFAAVVLAWGAALAAQILAALVAGSLVALARLRLKTTDAVEALQLVMHEAAATGVRQALDEANRAGVNHGLTPQDVTINTAELDELAEALAEHTASVIAGTAGREAQRLGTAPDEAEVDAVIFQILTPGPVPQMVSEAVARAMAGGRVEAMEAVIEATPGIEWEITASGVRDVNQCGPCDQNDGRVYPDLATGRADFPLGLYKACLGRTRCRCLLIMRPKAPQ